MAAPAGSVDGQMSEVTSGFATAPTADVPSNPTPKYSNSGSDSGDRMSVPLIVDVEFVEAKAAER